jgi:hypothetical protein
MTDHQQSTRIAWFDSLPPVRPSEMVGVWRGEGIPSGHPLDGVLENLQWFGKRFDPDLRADALLFQWRPGRLVPIEPSFFPIRLSLRLATVWALVRRPQLVFIYSESFPRTGNDSVGRAAGRRRRRDGRDGL